MGARQYNLRRHSTPSRRAIESGVTPRVRSGPRVLVVGRWAEDRRQETILAEVEKQRQEEFREREQEIRQHEEEITRLQQQQRALLRLIILHHKRQLLSIYDRAQSAYIYQHGRDRRAPIAITYFRGRCVSLHHCEFGVLYIKGLTHI